MSQTGRWALGAVMVVMGLMGGVAEAKDLVWDRNTEADMFDYAVYACETAGCTVQQIAAQRRASVAQTAAGVLPKWTLPPSLQEGAIAVSARDQSGNESGLSVSIPFDQKAPTIPVNPRLQ